MAKAKCYNCETEFMANSDWDKGKTCQRYDDPDIPRCPQCGSKHWYLVTVEIKGG